ARARPCEVGQQLRGFRDVGGARRQALGQLVLEIDLARRRGGRGPWLTTHRESSSKRQKPPRISPRRSTCLDSSSRRNARVEGTKANRGSKPASSAQRALDAVGRAERITEIRRSSSAYWAAQAAWRGSVPGWYSPPP